MSNAPQPSLWTHDQLDQLRPPWWSVIGGNLAAAGTAEAEAAGKRARKTAQQAARRRSIAERARSQPSLRTLPPRVLDIPTDPRTCDGKGICPVLGCRWNLLVDIRRTRNEQTGEETETITVGGRGGNGSGVSLAAKRTGRGQVHASDLTAIVDAVVARADTLPASCLWDYVRDQDLIPCKATDTEGDVKDIGVRPHMTLAQIAEVFGVTREAIRQVEIRALLKLKESDGAQELDPTFVPLSRLRSSE